MGKKEHANLVEVGARWLKNNLSCSVTLKELTAYTSYGETPDVLGFNSTWSFMIECKISRSDYFADKKKIFREYEEFGMGQFRFIMCPAGLLLPKDIYPGWGLLWVKGEKVHKQNFNIAFGKPKKIKQFEAHYKSERTMLVSHLRRLKTK